VAQKEMCAFMGLYCEVQSLRTERRLEALRVKEQSLQKLLPILEKSAAVLESRAAGEFDWETAQKKLREICPDKGTQMEVIKFLWPTLQERLDLAGEEPSANKQDPAEKERESAGGNEDLAKSGELLDAAEQVQKALGIVSDQVLAGVECAIEQAAAMAEHAVALLLIAQKLHPEMTRKVAARRMHWPMLGSREPGWARRAAARLESLQVGRNLECLRARFREARGADENYPARQWAKAAVRMLEDTRRRFIIYADYKEEFREMILDGKMELAPAPRWVDEVLQLRAFSSATARQWGKVVREMIREEMPDFHTAPEWQNQRNTAKQSCRDSPGEIRNAILDDISSALTRIAPPENQP